MIARLFRRAAEILVVLKLHVHWLLRASVSSIYPMVVRDYKYVVSLTSYPPRFPTLHLTLKSLLLQDCSEFTVCLWVCPEDKEKLPKCVTDLVQHGLQIECCPNLRSYKKLLPALQKWPELPIITADDDVYYWPRWLSALVKHHEEAPRNVICHRFHKIEFDSKQAIRPYVDWIENPKKVEDHDILFATGVGGVLYPPHSLDNVVTDWDLANELCPTNDDIWFHWMTYMAGTSITVTSCFNKLPAWRNSQNQALWRTNVSGSANDDQIRKMGSHFGWPWRSFSAK